MLKNAPWLIALTLAVGACNDFLNEQPPDQLPADKAITNMKDAKAALAGAYNGLQDLSYYGGDFLFFNDLSADNATHTGTFSSFADADANQLRADNGTVLDIWNAIYIAVNRCNVILKEVPAVSMDQTTKDEILGEAYLLRALHFHNLVKLYSDIPLPLTPISSPSEAGQYARTSVTGVYTQIQSDLAQAEALITNTTPTDQANVGAVKALEARVFLYQGDYPNAEARADDVINMGYSLAPNYASLFDAEGVQTPEDIWKVTFTTVYYQNMGYYYISNAHGGRGELGVDSRLFSAYEPGDLRRAHDIHGNKPQFAYATKWPTTYGAEDVHIIRFAEVLLIKSEAQARQSNLTGAVATYNLIRQRAGLPPHTFGVEVTNQQEVLDQIDKERRLELAFEGDRWADLVRTGRVITDLNIPVQQTLYPIPQAERDVSPLLTQNPGY